MEIESGEILFVFFQSFSVKNSDNQEQDVSERLIAEQ